MSYIDISKQIAKSNSSNIITLYHGSLSEIGKPVYGKGNVNNDYGRGFYLTEDADLAKEWAALYGKPNRCYLNVYKLDISDLNIFRFDDEDHLQWLAVLLNNRKCSRIDDDDNDVISDALEILHNKKYVDLSNYDCAIGWRADDSYFSYVSDYVLGLTTKEKFIKAIRYGNLGSQFVILSKKAFDKIEYVGCEALNYSLWFKKAMERDNKARAAYRLSRINNQRQSVNQFIEEVYKL